MSAARCPSRPDDTAPQSLREPGTVSLAATTLPHTAAGKASGIAGGSGVADAPVCRFRDADGSPDDGLEETLYYTQDANCNVTALVNTSGGVVERYTYDAYGKVTFRQNDWSLQAVQGSPDGAASPYDNQILYAGYRFDPESGLYHVRNRPYHPTLGRWNSRDPMEYADGMNLYAYCGATPVEHLDASGTDAASDASAGVKKFYAIDSVYITQGWFRENKYTFRMEIKGLANPAWEGTLLKLNAPDDLQPVITQPDPENNYRGFQKDLVITPVFKKWMVKKQPIDSKKGCQQECQFWYGYVTYQKKSVAGIAIDELIAAALKETTPTHTNDLGKADTNGQSTTNVKFPTLNIPLEPNGSGSLVFTLVVCADGSVKYERRFGPSWQEKDSTIQPTTPTFKGWNTPIPAMTEPSTPTTQP